MSVGRAPGPQRLTGVVRRVVLADPGGDRALVDLDPSPDPEASAAIVRCTGPLGGLVSGEAVTLLGRWCEPSTEGATFVAIGYERRVGTSLGLPALLEEEAFAAVPKRVRARVVSQFGAGVGRVLATQPERLVQEAGIDAEHAAGLHRAWVAQRSTVELIRLVAPAGWSMGAVRSVEARFGPDAAALAREDPYAMLVAPEVGFVLADALAAELGIAGHDPRRLAAGARWVVDTALAQHGHQHLIRRICRAATARLLRVDALLADAGIDAAVARGELAGEQVDGDQVVSTPEVLAAEQDLARHLHRLNGAVTVVTDGPGGSAKAVIREVLGAARVAGLDVDLVAPTEAAAACLAPHTGSPVTTIDAFVRSPSGAEVVIVDDMARCGTRHVAQLLAAVDDGAEVLLVGDPHLLPAVEPGDVLRDLVASGRVPVLAPERRADPGRDERLDAFAQAVLEGELGPLPGVDGGVFVAEESRPAAIVGRVVAAVRERIPAHLGVLPEQVLVLAPAREGPLGADALAAALGPGPGRAVTVAQAPGGCWPVVVLVCDASHRAALDRATLYTAVRHAHEALILVGQRETLRAAARTHRPSERRTGLVWRMSSAPGAGTEVSPVLSWPCTVVPRGP